MFLEEQGGVQQQKQEIISAAASVPQQKINEEQNTTKDNNNDNNTNKKKFVALGSSPTENKTDFLKVSTATSSSQKPEQQRSSRATIVGISEKISEQAIRDVCMSAAEVRLTGSI